VACTGFTLGLLEGYSALVYSLPVDILWEIQYKEEILGYIGG
jgi:hypothetical protein